MAETKKSAPVVRPIRDVRAQTSKPAQKITRSQLIKLIQEAQKGKNAKYRKIALVVFIVLAAIFVFNYIQTRNELNRAANPEKVAQEQAADLSGEVSKYLELPQGETPTVATVSDVEKLKDQAFFKNAQNGDQVLIYSNAGRAVLYRPSTKKIIEFTQINTSPSK